MGKDWSPPVCGASTGKRRAGGMKGGLGMTGGLKCAEESFRVHVRVKIAHHSSVSSLGAVAYPYSCRIFA